jgi:hypothetical protein
VEGATYLKGDEKTGVNPYSTHHFREFPPRATPRCRRVSMSLTLRPLTIGPPVYAHLADYEVMEDGRSIGSIKQEREEEPRNPERAWSWSLTIVGARLAGIKT